MQSKHEKQLPELISYLFHLLTQTKANLSEQWYLINEIPKNLLVNGMLQFVDIDMQVFGYKISQINFRHCIFSNCIFSNQIFVDCDFRECSFENTKFYGCKMDQATADSLRSVANFLSDQKTPSHIDIHIEEQISFESMSNICKSWFYSVSHYGKALLQIFSAINEKESEEKVIQFLFDQLKPFNSRFDSIILEPESNYYSFFFYARYKSEKYRGWKLHLSVDEQSVKQAYDCIAPILLDNFDLFYFKVIDLSIPESERDNYISRLYNGGQFTIYLYQDGIKPLASEQRLKKLVLEITEKLQSAGIATGEIPESDSKTFYPYFSLRNDGDHAIEYYYGLDVGKNYNPYNLPGTFDFLLPEKSKKFNVEEHLLLFNRDTDEQYAMAFIASLFALMHSYLKPVQVFDKEVMGISSGIIDDWRFLLLQDKVLDLSREDISESDQYLLTILLITCHGIKSDQKSDEIKTGADLKRHQKRKVQIAKNLIQDFSTLFQSYSCSQLYHYSCKNSLQTCNKNKLAEDLNRLISLMPFSFAKEKNARPILCSNSTFFLTQNSHNPIRDRLILSLPQHLGT